MTPRAGTGPSGFGLCDRCGAEVEGTIIAYDFGSRAVVCGCCADEAGIAAECRESKRAREERLIREAGA